MELTTGRPADVAGREEKEIAAYDFLDRLGVTYVRVDHAAAMSMAACAEIDGTLGTTICKNLFLCNRQKTKYYLLMMPGSKVFKTSIASAQIGTSRLSFAPPEVMEACIHTLPGSASVLGLMHDTEKKVQLVIDREVLAGEYVGCHPLVNTTSLRIRTADFEKIILPALGHTPILVDLPRTVEEAENA